jgi:hypothetical protein
MVYMEPAEVGRISQELKAIGDVANTEIGKLFPTSDAAVAGNQGWQTAAALTACVKAWQDETHAEIEEVKSHATYLATSGAMVKAYDKEGERRLRAVLAELANIP